MLSHSDVHAMGVFVKDDELVQGEKSLCINCVVIVCGLLQHRSPLSSLAASRTRIFYGFIGEG